MYQENFPMIVTNLIPITRRTVGRDENLILTCYIIVIEQLITSVCIPRVYNQVSVELF